MPNRPSCKCVMQREAQSMTNAMAVYQATAGVPTVQGAT